MAIGSLEKPGWGAKVNVDLVFDLHNKTNTPSPEIEAIYLYTRHQWKFLQDGQECVSTTSDELGYGDRHFIKPPVQTITLYWMGTDQTNRFKVRRVWGHERTERQVPSHRTYLIANYNR